MGTGLDLRGGQRGLPRGFLLQAVESEVAQSCPTLRDPMDCSLPGSSVQAIVLEWIAISFSRGSSDPGIEPGSLSF